MSDTSTNKFNAQGDTAARTAFTPSPGTPTPTPAQGYTFWDTDDQVLYAWETGTGWVATGGAGSSVVVQVKNTQTGAVATGSTGIPYDDTIPQNTEGDEYMTLAITPTSATNKLRIDVVWVGTTVGQAWIIVALFQDSTANALAAACDFHTVSTSGTTTTFTHYMTSGTTSATTFKVRAGIDSGGAGGTMTFNGQSGGRIFGGVSASSITITEIVP